ncbi:site-specific recombinase [Filimonas lacunae]|nr:site-specific recombinase [Filimonas lacunae]
MYIESVENDFHLHILAREQGLDFLIDLFNKVRPRKGKDNAETRLQLVIKQLQEKPHLLQNLRVAVMAQLGHTNFVPALTESGMLLSRGFVQELGSRLSHKLLPSLQQEDELIYILNRIFYKKNDYIWVEAIDRNTWKAFFDQLNISLHQQHTSLPQQLRQALLVLSYRVANFSLDPEVVRFLPEEMQANNVFIRQNHIINQLQTKEEFHIPDTYAFPGIDTLNGLVDECMDTVQRIQELQAIKGASLSLSYLTLSMRYNLARMKILADVLENNKNFTTDKLVDFFRLEVHYEKRKNSIRELFSRTFGHIAYQIAEHKGTKGDKYITTTRLEYAKMMVSAMWGGLIVCLMVLFKTLLGKVHMLPLWLGAAYSVNYSLGFVAIEETKATLATKQPAFTASAVAGSLDVRKNEQPNLYSLAITVARVTRSQFASFFGNLVVVFPVTYLIAWLYDLCFAHKLVEGPQAMKLLIDQHPWKSLSLLYACNTGVFLFVSGLIAGFIQNKIQYSRVAERMQMHPVMRLTIPGDRLRRLAHYIEHHAGSLTGNIVLGFFLGMSSVVVKLFGIPFDIRHITISAGNVAMGAYGLGLQNIPWQLLTQVIAGVLAIGFFNFLVSFALAFIVAVKSRGIRLRDYPEFIRILWRYFKKYPFDFIRPRKNGGITEA